MYIDMNFSHTYHQSGDHHRNSLATLRKKNNNSSSNSNNNPNPDLYSDMKICVISGVTGLISGFDCM